MDQSNGNDAPSLPRWESFLINGHEFGGDFPSGPYNRMIAKLYGTGGESSETINKYRMDNQQPTMGPTSGQSLYPFHESVQKKSLNRLLSVSVQPRQEDMAVNTHSASQLLCSPNKKIHEDVFSRFGLSGAQLATGEKQDEPTKSSQSKDLVFSRFRLSGAQLPNGLEQDEPTKSGLAKDLLFSRFGLSGAQLPNGEKQGEPSNLVSVDGQSKEHDEKLKVDGVPPGVIFMCNRKTRQTCFQFSLFGLPGSQIKLVRRIVPGTKLFLFVLDSRELQGIFEATSNGGFNLDAMAFVGAFPSQVRFRICKECKPLAEKDFREAIKDNYFAHNKFSNELTSQQVSSLIQLFCPEGFVDGKIQNHQDLLLRHSNAGSSRDYAALDLAENQSEKSMDISPQNSPTMGRGEDIYGKERNYLTSLRVPNRPYKVNASDKYLHSSLYSSNLQPRASSIQSHLCNEWPVEGNFHHNKKHHDSLHPSYAPSCLQSGDGEISGSRFSEETEKGKFQAHDSLEASDQYVPRSRSWFPETVTGDSIEQNRILQPNSMDRNAYNDRSGISGQERAEHLDRVYQFYEQEFYASRGLLQGQIDGSSLHTHKRVSDDILNNTSNSHPLKKPNYYRESHQDMLKENTESVNRLPDNGDWMKNSPQVENRLDKLNPMQVFSSTHHMPVPNPQELERGLVSQPTESGLQHFYGPVGGPKFTNRY
ncbi:uncharacterized protein LOC131036785 [Cryptomeria japonica]|uniref:uncharacterized protein LOC131036785 n=1 Tax=Cryptomeria japonica TaxID=3369 RepID=UPI0027D9E599|nr:uncharacterized protein LOC131036785 [Cryptomeria japonica]